MKIAVFSDVHSCYSKMLAVLDEIKRYHVDKIICLGDIIGYGDKPEETVELLIENNVTAIRGNHELAIFNLEHLTYFPHDIKKPLLENIRMISAKSVRYLKNTKPSLTVGECHFVHGTPPDLMTTYIYDVSDYYLKSIFNQTKSRIFFTGHTHKLKLITYKDRNIYRRRIKRERVIHIESIQKYLLNVGSIGFSRDDFEASKFAVYDSEEQTITIRMIGLGPDIGHLGVGSHVTKA